MNTITIVPQSYEQLLSKFPAEVREKLRVYTGEELFYAWRLMLFVPKKDSNGDYKPSDMLYLALKSKLTRYLKGIERHPIAPTAWSKLGAKFRNDFLDWASMQEEYNPNDLTG